MHTGGTPIPKFEFSHNYINIGGIWWHFGGVFRALVARGGAFPFFSHRGSRNISFCNYQNLTCAYSQFVTEKKPIQLFLFFSELQKLITQSFITEKKSKKNPINFSTT